MRPRTECGCSVPVMQPAPFCTCLVPLGAIGDPAAPEQYRSPRGEPDQHQGTQ